MLQINEKLQRLLPEPTEEELAHLEDSLQKDGCIDPIITWNNVIIDGHHRYDICTRHNIPFQVKEMEFVDITQAMHWMIDHQMARRNLNNYQKAKIALQYEAVYREEAEARKLAGTKTEGDPNDRRTDAMLGKLVGLSRDSIAKVRKIEAEADEETREKLARGEIRINKAISLLNQQPEKERIFGNPEGDDTVCCTVLLRLMFEKCGLSFEGLGEAHKDDVKDKKLIDHKPNPFTTRYEIGRAHV